jgi:hypothetical protein
MQEAMQPVLIDFRNAQEFHPELAMLAPSDRGGFDGNR